MDIDKIRLGEFIEIITALIIKDAVNGKKAVFITEKLMCFLAS